MAPYETLIDAKEAVELYFVENRARLLDIASFLDRIDRYAGADEAKADFRYRALMKALRLLAGDGKEKTKAIQMLFSDHSVDPLDSAVGLKAFGAWEGAGHEGD